MKKLFFYLFVGKAQRLFWSQILFLAALFACVALLVCVFKDEIYRQEIYVVRQETIRVYCLKNGKSEPIPAWAPQNLVDEALKFLPLEKRGQKLYVTDKEIEKTLASAFQKHPLVSKVHRVLCEYPSTVRVFLELRTPVALVDASAVKRDKFYSKALERFPNDKNFLAKGLSLLELNAENAGENDPAARYVVDADGSRLPNKYFKDHPDFYQSLPIVLGIGVEEGGASVDQLLKEGCAFLRFLDESTARSALRITTIAVANPYGASHGVWYFQTESGSIVKWGLFVPSRQVKNETAAARGVQQSWEDLYNFQYRKLVDLNNQIKENALEVETRRNSTDESERSKAEELRKTAYDVSTLLLGEEEN